MPFVDGESLREKLNRERQLGIEESIEITKSVAGALDYAHRHNVIHRDIKPENILIHDGQPVVADFGIALAVRAAGGERLTETGLSLGTPQYMSPEQASGDREVDGRSDIYSLGSVLYEMLTGEPPHVGPTVQAVVAKLLSEKPRPVTDLRETVPGHVAAVVNKALAKLPADRFRGATDLSQALSDRSYTADTMRSPEQSKRSRWQWNDLSTALTVLAGLLLVTTVWALARMQSNEPLLTYDVGLPEIAPMSLIFQGTVLSVSPRGDFVVYVATADTTLWYRSLIDGDAHEIPGTEGARLAAVSPGADAIAFVTQSAVKVVPVSGGPAEIIADGLTPASVQWLSDSQLFFGDDDFTMLRWVDIETSEAEVRELQCSIPFSISDNAVLCGGGGLLQAYVLDVSNGTSHYVKHRGGSPTGNEGYLRGSDFRLVDDSYVTYMSVDGNLRAAPFDLETLEAGRPVTLVTGIRRQAYTGSGQYSVGSDGTLVYAEGVNGDVGNLVALSQDGRLEPLVAEPAMFLRWGMSPGGEKLAAVVEAVGGQELRVYDLERRLWDVWISAEFINEPCWVRGSERIIFGTTDRVNERWAVLVGSPTSTAYPDTLFIGSGLFGYDIRSCTDPARITASSYGSAQHIVTIDISGSAPTLDTIVADGNFGTLSPDGERLAYEPVGLSGIAVAPFPELDREIPVARHRSEPLWLSSSELVFWGEGGRFYRLSLGTASDMRIGSDVLWHTDPRFSDTPGGSYKITATGGLVYVQEPEKKPATYLRVIPNWVEQMKHAVDEANR
jgi:serine/threonine-protein kinase